MTSKKPYLLRALHEWICDNDCTPYLYVDTQVAGVVLPPHLLDENPLVLNVSYNACKNLQLSDGSVSFQARFSGEVAEVFLPIGAIIAIVARETGQGMSFDWAETPSGDTDVTGGGDGSVENDSPSTKRRGGLRVIK